jgi:hypothetical protein
MLTSSSLFPLCPIIISHCHLVGSISLRNTKSWNVIQMFVKKMRDIKKGRPRTWNKKVENERKNKNILPKGKNMVKYANRKHLFFWKVSIKYTLIYWIHEYYLSQCSWTFKSSLTPLHNIEKPHVLICI